jgi:hypothetical protein
MFTMDRQNVGVALDSRGVAKIRKQVCWRVWISNQMAIAMNSECSAYESLDWKRNGSAEITGFLFEST